MIIDIQKANNYNKTQIALTCVMPFESMYCRSARNGSRVRRVGDFAAISRKLRSQLEGSRTWLKIGMKVSCLMGEEITQSLRLSYR